MAVPNNQFDLGSAELNGSDGDTARQAGEKYNTHVHQTANAQAAIDNADAPTGANVFITESALEDVVTDYALTSVLGTAAFEDAGSGIGHLLQIVDIGGAVAGLPAIDGSQLLNLPGGGGGGSGDTDWAAGLSVEVSADWTDAGSEGGLITTHLEDRTLGVRIRTDLKSDGVTPVAGNRVQGAIRAIAGGDFKVGIRYRLDIPGVLINANSAVLSGGPVFIDGADLATASWYGVHQYLSSHNLLTAGTLSFQTEAGANRFDATAGQYGFGTIFNGGFGGPWMGLTDFDVFIERTGTDLIFYMGAARCAVHKIASWTVTAGAGWIGMRLQVQSGEPNPLQAVIIAYDDTFVEFPW